MRTIFWGTPQAAVPFLDHLNRKKQIAGVVTRTDKPSARGLNLQKSPVKIFAEEHGLPVLQPDKLKDADFLKNLASWKADLGIVVAYGKILPKEVIQIFSKGLINVHFSLLPRLRGAAPIQWAILQGEENTGVSTFKISESLDSGNLIVQKKIGISKADNAVTLEEKLIPLGIQACSAGEYLRYMYICQYLRWLIFLLEFLIPPCDSPSLAFYMMYSAYKLSKQGDNIQP